MGARYSSCHKSQQEMNKVSFIKCCGALHATGKLLLWEKVASEPCSVVYPVPGCPSPKWAHIPWPTSAPPSHLQHPRQRCGPIPKPSFSGSDGVPKASAGSGAGAGPRRWGAGSRSPQPVFGTPRAGTVHARDTAHGWAALLSATSTCT